MALETNHKIFKNSKKSFKNFVSINDLRDKEFNSLDLNTNERLALKNFDRYRIKVLSNKTSEKEFHNSYQKLQVLANLSPYQEFLKEEYYL